MTPDATPSDQRGWRAEYPFPSHFLSCDGPKLHYLDQGKGEPILCVHGNPTWSFYWRHVVRAFATDHRVVAVDHIGCGLSDKPLDYRYTLSQHTNNLATLVEQLDLRNITLVAHDWGGAIGLGTVVQFPDRFTRIVLLNTGAFPPPFCPWRIRVCRWPVVRSLGVCGLNAFARAALHMTTTRTRLSSTTRSGLIAPYDSWNHRIAIRRFVEDIPLSARHPTWPVLEKLEADLKRLAPVPTALIWGMRDWCFTPQCLDRLEAIFPHAQTTRIDDAGHYVMEDATEDVLAAIESFIRPACPTSQ